MYSKKKVSNINESVEQTSKNNIGRNEDRVIKFGGKHLKYLNKSNIKSESEYFKIKDPSSQDKTNENQFGFKKEELKE